MIWGFDKTFYNEDYCNTNSFDYHKGGIQRIGTDTTVQYGPQKGAGYDSWMELRHYKGEDNVKYWFYWAQDWGSMDSVTYNN